MKVDVNLSINYLEKAIRAAKKAKINHELLPLDKTYLNLAEGYSFLEKHVLALECSNKAIKFARMRYDSAKEEFRAITNKLNPTGAAGPNIENYRQ